MQPRVYTTHPPEPSGQPIALHKLSEASCMRAARQTLDGSNNPPDDVAMRRLGHDVVREDDQTGYPPRLREHDLPLVLDVLVNSEGKRCDIKLGILKRQIKRGSCHVGDLART